MILMNIQSYIYMTLASPRNLLSGCETFFVNFNNMISGVMKGGIKTGEQELKLHYVEHTCFEAGKPIEFLACGSNLLQPKLRGHVPYRDSKLTCILQPELGGNANTAIICNITLAQIHVDETKSSLQFASRALSGTNCVHVNEGSHSKHLGDKILNLQNTVRKPDLLRDV